MKYRGMEAEINRSARRAVLFDCDWCGKVIYPGDVMYTIDIPETIDLFCFCAKCFKSREKHIEHD